MTSHSKYRIDIQYLRGIAVLSVLLYHGFENRIINGLLGVDVFFVISGFVVAPLILELTRSSSVVLYLKSFCLFIRNRFFRLAPALFATLILCALVIVTFFSIGDLSRISKQGIYTIFLLGNVGAYKFSGDYFNPTPNPLIHTWSLAVEEQIYILLPLILILTLATKVYRVRFISGAILIIGTTSLLFYLSPSLLQPLYHQIGISNADWAGFYFPTSRLWEFLIGFSIHFFKSSVIENNKRHYIQSIFRIAILLTLLIAPIRLESRLLGLSVVIITTAIIYKSDLYVLHNSVKKFLRWTGDRSYSIYLVHMPLISIPLTSPIYEELKFYGTCVFIILSVLMGSVFYNVFEKPFRIRRGENDENFNELRIKFFKTLALMAVSLLAFIVLILGSNNKYWGLDKNIEVPQYAGFLDPNCERDSRNGPPCIYPQLNASRSVLLIGDSHAGHLSQAIVDSAGSSGWNSIIWTHSSCRFELSESVPNWCRNVNNEIIDYVRRSKPDVVILSQANDAKDKVSRAVDSLVKLKSVSKKLLIVHETPRFNDVRFMNSGALLQAPYIPSRFQTINIKTQDYFMTADEIYSSSALRGIVVLDLTDVFCQNEKCYRWKQGNWLYRDQSHLSVAGANLAVPKFFDFFRQYKDQ